MKSNAWWSLLAVAVAWLSPANGAYFVSVQDKYSGTSSRARLASLTVGSSADASQLTFLGNSNKSVSDYAAESLAYDAQTGQLFFVKQVQAAGSTVPGNYTKIVAAVSAAIGGGDDLQSPQQVFQLNATAGKFGVSAPQVFGLAIDTQRRSLFFCHGAPGPSATKISRIYLDAYEDSYLNLNLDTVFNGVGAGPQGVDNLVFGMQLDTVTGQLYASTSMGIVRVDVASVPPWSRYVTSYASLSPYTFRIDGRNRRLLYMQYGDAGLAVLSRPLDQLNSTAAESVLFNSSLSPADGRISSAGQVEARFHIDLDAGRLVVFGGPEVYAVAYPADQSHRATLLYNATVAYAEVAMLYAMTDGQPTYEPSPFAVAITVLTSLAIGAALMSAGISAGGGGAGGASSTTATTTTTTTTAATTATGGSSGTASTSVMQQALTAVQQQPTTLLIALISQLQFMVMLGQLGGAMPYVYDQFVAGVSWIWLGFRNASFGLATSTAASGVADGLHKFAQMLQMDRGRTFASVMIIVLLICLCLAVLYGVAHVVAARVAHGGDAKKVTARKETINRMASKLAGHLFLLSYVTLCTTSVNQLTIDDVAAGFFAGLVLILVCTSVLIILYLAVYPPKFAAGQSHDSFKEKLLAAVSGFSSALYQKFLQGPLCNDFVDSAHFTGFVLMAVKYCTGIVTGAGQTLPTLQVSFILALILMELTYVAVRRPYKVAVLWYLHLTSALVRLICVMIKLGLVAANDTNNAQAGAAMLALNGVLILVMIAGIFAGILAKSTAVRNFFKANRVQASKGAEDKLASNAKMVDDVEKSASVAEK